MSELLSVSTDHSLGQDCRQEVMPKVFLIHKERVSVLLTKEIIQRLKAGGKNTSQMTAINGKHDR